MASFLEGFLTGALEQGVSDQRAKKAADAKRKDRLDQHSLDIKKLRESLTIKQELIKIQEEDKAKKKKERAAQLSASYQEFRQTGDYNTFTETALGLGFNSTDISKLLEGQSLATNMSRENRAQQQYDAQYGNSTVQPPQPMQVPAPQPIQAPSPGMPDASQFPIDTSSYEVPSDPYNQDLNQQQQITVPAPIQEGIIQDPIEDMNKSIKSRLLQRKSVIEQLKLANQTGDSNTINAVKVSLDQIDAEIEQSRKEQEALLKTKGVPKKQLNAAYDVYKSTLNGVNLIDTMIEEVKENPKSVGVSGKLRTAYKGPLSALSQTYDLLTKDSEEISRALQSEEGYKPGIFDPSLTGIDRAAQRLAYDYAKTTNSGRISNLNIEDAKRQVNTNMSPEVFLSTLYRMRNEMIQSSKTAVSVAKLDDVLPAIPKTYTPSALRGGKASKFEGGDIVRVPDSKRSTFGSDLAIFDADKGKFVPYKGE